MIDKIKNKAYYRGCNFEEDFNITKDEWQCSRQYNLHIGIIYKR